MCFVRCVACLLVGCLVLFVCVCLLFSAGVLVVIVGVCLLICWLLGVVDFRCCSCDLFC